MCSMFGLFPCLFLLSSFSIGHVPSFSTLQQQPHSSNMNYQNGKRTTAVLCGRLFPYYIAKNCEFVIFKLEYLVMPSYLPSLLGFLSALPKKWGLQFHSGKETAVSLASVLALPCHPNISTKQKKTTKKAENKVWSVLPYPISHPNQLTTKPYTIPTAGHHYHNSTIASTKLPATLYKRFPSLSSICSFTTFYMDQVTSTSLSVLSQVSCWNQRLSVRVAFIQ